jgi:hypothetical protein
MAACKAARTINELRPDNHPEHSYQHKLPAYNFLYGVWSTILSTITQVQSDHNAIQMVVNLVAELKKLDVMTLNIWGQDIRLWTELPLLGPEYRELREQFQKEEFEKSGLKVFRDKLEADGVVTLFNG